MPVLYILLCLLFIGCSNRPHFKTAQQSVDPGSEITWLGEKLKLTPVEGEGLQRNQVLPVMRLTNQRLEEQTLPTGSVAVISVIPSLDTPVCEVQTHSLSENPQLNSSVKRITVSMDLPYAQRRFAREAEISNVEFFSDFKLREFSAATGLLVAEKGVFARAVIVIDQRGKVQHLQVVPEVIEMPDMEKAFAKANQLISKESQ